MAQLIQYSVIVDTKTGEANIKSLTTSFLQADSSAKNLNNTLSQTTYTLNGLSGSYTTTATSTEKVSYATKDLNKDLGQMANKSGLAGAAVVEIGRTISDANYGMMAMANNLQQVATLMVTLISTSGGLRNGFSLLLSAFKGPLGFIVLFQIAISLIERFAMNQRKAKEETTGLTEAIKSQAGILEILGNFATVSNDALDALRRNFKEVGAFLDEAERTNFGLSPDIIDFAIEQGRKLIEARERIKNITEKLTKQEEGYVLSQEQREKLQYDLVAAYEAESQALNKLAVQKSEEVVVTAQNDDKEAVIQEKKENRLHQSIDAFFTAQEKERQERINHQDFLDFEAERIKKRDEDVTKGKEEKAKKRKEIEEIELEHALMTYEAIGSGLQSLSRIIGEETAAGKAFAVAGALIDTYAAINGILKNTAKTAAGAIPGYAIAQAVATGLFGLAQVKKILSVQVPGGRGGGGGGGSAGSMAPAPSPTFNVVGSSGSSQLREAVEKGMEKPVKAYVTQKDINSSAELDRNTRKSATIV